MAAKKKDYLNDADYLAFVEWEGIPSGFIDEDEPHTLEQFANKISKTRKTLSEWRKLPGHWKRVTDCYSKYHAQRMIDVRDALYRRTQGVCVDVGRDRHGDIIYKDLPPDPKAIELFLKYEDKWQEKIKTEVEGTITINADEAAKNVLEALKTVKSK